MDDRFSILTVCTGNIHRSALAAALLERWRTWYLLDPVAAAVTVTSAGFDAPSGAPMGTRAQAIARALGADGSAHLATRMTDRMISDADLVLVASVHHRDETVRRVPAALRKTFTIREAGRIAASLDLPHPPAGVDDLLRTVALLAGNRVQADDSDDIIDPQGRNEEAHLQMANEEVPALARLAHALLGMPKSDADAYIDVAGTPEALRAQLRKVRPGA
ncbi:hypothetical protein [uncultured Microbacterium sp.]|uniref:arsenate reductase/protein-tyrosine-phosphatase family protein n=1 Tax=uncultured Microbacterium sp. TaxID=191216 RepID=UPI0028D0721A|nr:hypothetical protein [uncultured Microbacterium sp.]